MHFSLIKGQTRGPERERGDSPGFKMLNTAKALEISIDHDSQAVTQSLTLFHAAGGTKFVCMKCNIWMTYRPSKFSKL